MNFPKMWVKFLNFSSIRLNNYIADFILNLLLSSQKSNLSSIHLKDGKIIYLPIPLFLNSMGKRVFCNCNQIFWATFGYFPHFNIHSIITILLKW